MHPNRKPFLKMCFCTNLAYSFGCDATSGNYWQQETFKKKIEVERFKKPIPFIEKLEIVIANILTVLFKTNG